MSLTIVAAVAAAIVAGCSQQRQCVDAQGNPLPDSACQSPATSSYHYPHYVYTGGGGGYSGGGYSRSYGSSTVRGGFGGFGHGGGGE
jgi:hypothetical protein